MITDAALFGLNDSHTQLVDSSAQSGHRLQSDVATAFRTLQYIAEQEGIDCQLVSSFRPFSRQLAIWERKWHGELPVLDVAGQALDIDVLDDWGKVQAILTWSALPGASRHHWGTDMDVYDKQQVQASGIEFNLVEAEYTGDGPCAELSNFLQQSAPKLGFFFPYHTFKGGVANEPWHISHKASAAAYEEALSEQKLLAFIHSVSLSGKDTILSRFDEIYTRFVCNQGLE